MVLHIMIMKSKDSSTTSDRNELASISKALRNR
jgi:hypothetical protein